MLKAAYKITLGGRVIDTTAEPRASTLVDLGVTLSMAPAADAFRMILAKVGEPFAERGQEAALELGYADDGGLSKVISATVLASEPGLTHHRLSGHGAAAALLRSFADETFQSKSAGAIVRDLAGRAGVDVERAEEGIEFPAYVIDSRRSFYCHMHELAALNGFDLYLNPEGGLVFERFAGGRTLHELAHALHILELEVEDSNPRAAAVEAWGESPGSSRGDESWAWLTKDFGGLRGRAGGGDPVLLLERSALRTAQGAQSAAQAAHLDIQRRRRRGRVLVQGSPQIKLGDAVRLRDVPEAPLNDTYQVRRVFHRIDKTRGFTTEIALRSVA